MSRQIKEEFGKSEERKNELKSLSALLDESYVEDEHNFDDDYNMTGTDLNTNNVPIELIGSAPASWNTWTRIPRVRKILLMESIDRLGLLHNIVCWKVPEEYRIEHEFEFEYMVLSGHNRLDCYKELYESTSDSKYREIRVLVKHNEVMNESIAKLIIDDANEQGRIVSAQDRAFAVKRRYTELQNDDRFDSEKKVLTFIADEDDKDYRQVKRYFDLNKLIPEIFSLTAKVINIKTGVVLAQLPQDTQNYIYRKYYLDNEKRQLFCNKTLSKLRKNMTISKIDSIMDVKNHMNEVVYRSVQVPENILDEVNKLIRDFEKVNE